MNTERSNRHEGSDSFSAAERRLAVTRERMPNFPVEYATVTRLMRHINKRTQDLINEALLPFGLNTVGYNTLMVLFGTEDNVLNASELAESAGEKRANITRICDELVTKKLIRRVPGVNDRRSVMVSLTAAGKRMVESMQPGMRKVLDVVYRDFGAKDLGTLQELLRRQLEQINRHAGGGA